MKTILRTLIGVGLLAIGGGVAALLHATKPEADKKSDDARPAPVVIVAPVKYEALQLTLPSQGLIDARRRTRISAEVGGRVVEVSPKFNAGQDFSEGEVLLQIDRSDYQAAFVSAQAQLADAELALQTEKARGALALRDWKSLGSRDAPSDLTLRKPHQASAEAAILSAEEGVERANRDLERTVIKAPYDGRLASVDVELGAFLPPGSPVAEIFSAAPWEIRLPLSLEDWAFLDRDGEGNVTGDVGFKASAGGEEFEWKGKVLRTEGEVDRSSRSIYLVAELSGNESDPLMQPGLFVQARIAGKTMDRVASIPAKAFVGLNEVAVVDQRNKLQKRVVTVLRRSGDDVLISGGLDEKKERLCLTLLSNVVNDMDVDPREKEPDAVLTGEPGEVTTKP